VPETDIQLRMPTELKLRAVAELLPYARNARTHSAEQIDQLKRFMREVGYTNPVLTHGDKILAGHGRILALQELGVKVVPTIDLAHLNEEQQRLLIIADNQLALNAGWDEKLLKVELTELRELDVDITLAGFSDEYLDQLLDEDKAPADPDAIPDVPEVPFAAPGQVWICGAHRVMCGDSKDATHWQALMLGEKADLVWTDPPYNVDIGAKNRGLDKADGGNRSKSGGIVNDAMADAVFLDFLCDVFRQLAANMKAGAAIYVAHADREGHNFQNAFRAAGFKFSSMLIWRKNQIVLGLTDYQSLHEPIMYGWKPGGRHRWYGGRKLRSVIELESEIPVARQADGRYAITIGGRVLLVPAEAELAEVPGSLVYVDKPSRSADHPTSKPVELVRRNLQSSGRPNDLVVDAFGGSGSTMIAAEEAGMCARVMELDARFVDVHCQRYYDFTGRVPVNAETGEPFPVKKGEE
jgi:DNA modification methylase